MRCNSFDAKAEIHKRFWIPSANWHYFAFIYDFSIGSVKSIGFIRVHFSESDFGPGCLPRGPYMSIAGQEDCQQQRRWLSSEGQSLKPFARFQSGPTKM